MVCFARDDPLSPAPWSVSTQRDWFSLWTFLAAGKSHVGGDCSGRMSGNPFAKVREQVPTHWVAVLAKKCRRDLDLLMIWH